MVFIPFRYPEGVDGLFSKQVALIVSQAEFSPSEHVSVFGQRQIGIGSDFALNGHKSTSLEKGSANETTCPTHQNARATAGRGGCGGWFHWSDLDPALARCPGQHRLG